MALIRKTFTYTLADDYLAQTRALGKTAQWEFIGPDTIWILINKETNKYTGRYFTEDQDGEHIPTPLDCYKVRIDCSSEPLLCSLLHTEVEKPDYADLSQHEELLPDGLTYKRPENPPPDHTHSITEMEFDPVSMSYLKPYPLIKPHVDWAGIRGWRNRILSTTDDKEGDHLDDGFPDALKTAWVDYRQHLRDIPQVHGASNKHVYLDLTAQAPYNQVGSTFIKVSDTTNIQIGYDVGVKGWPVEDIFNVGDGHTQVVSVDHANKIVELDKPLVLTPIENYNHELSFSPCPETHPWKIGAVTTPEGTQGVTGTNFHPDFDPTDPKKPLGDPTDPFTVAK